MDTIVNEDGVKEVRLTLEEYEELARRAYQVRTYTALEGREYVPVKGDTIYQIIH